jgi:ABC-type multidrug transport system fused ATPase/permease subunit
MLQIFSKLFDILDKRERKLAFYILILTMIVGTIEVLGVASIMPFMAILSNPSVVKTNTILSTTYNFLGFTSTDSYLFFIGVCVFILLVGSTFLKAFLVWAQTYYANLRNYSISSRMISGYIQQQYQWFLDHNSAVITASIIGEVSRVVNGVLYPIMRLIANAFITILLLSLFIVVDPVIAIGSMLILGSCYGLIYKYASSRLAKSGKVISVVQNKRIQDVNEAFGGIKDVKISSLENYFVEKYRIHAKDLALHMTYTKNWAEMPSFGMQALVFGGMMLITLYLLKTTNGLEQSIPVLAVYAIGGYKLMPALQEVYKQIAAIKANVSALDSVIEGNSGISPDAPLFIDYGDEETIPFEKSLEIRALHYSYPNTDKPALDGINLKVEKNRTIGFVGGSGSGKTTTVDIILGLLHPQEGGIYIDDTLISDKLIRSWQRNIGYVPQQIFLSDDSIAANIAFGIPSDKIDHAEVERAARTANLHNFIVNELPDGYMTFVGEQGIRLSGGQRQRIGIARALYYDPDVLILDEATSALDNLTEKAVMDAVKKLGHKKTIIMVAHRLSTVQSCDKIFLFDSGKIIANGTYDELIEASLEFRKMAQIQK